jgi:DNA-directed RNA polymerase specialized sigma24 family protein
VNHFNLDFKQLCYSDKLCWFKFALEELGFLMFEKRPEVSETLEWMLQSRQVGDEILVKTIVHEHYAEVHRFVQSITQAGEQIRASQFAEQVIGAGVKKAQEYRQDFPVKVWLFKLALEQFLRSDKNQNPVSIVVSEDSGHRSLALEAKKIIDSIPEVSRQAFLLKNVHRLTDQQTAYVLGVSEAEVKRRLSLIGIKWLEWLGGSSDSPAPEYRFQALFSKLWPLQELSEDEEQRITRRILAYLNEKERRKHRLIILGEVFLVVAAVAVVAGMGRLITELSPLPTSQIVFYTQVVNQVVLITPTPEPTLPPTPFPDSAILYRAEGGETLNDIADRILLNVTILEALNHIPANQELDAGQKIMIGVTEAHQLMPSIERDIEDQAEVIETPEPLTIHSSGEEIYDRVFANRDYWRSLWADALVIQYGPPGYVGDPDIRRQQIWIDQPFINFLVDGENGGEVENIYTSIGGFVNLQNLQTGEEILSTGSQRINYLPDLQQMLLPSEFVDKADIDLEILGQDNVSGREALVIDWFAEMELFNSGGGEQSNTRIHKGRYWIDNALGLILRKKTFESDDLTQLFKEILITKIEIDIPFPHLLFDREQDSQIYFAEDYKGNYAIQAAPVPESVFSPQPGRESIQHQPPPLDFAVEKSHLTFQWTSLEEFNSNLGTRVDLFGDGYYLSNVEFSEPRQLFCTRSTNGSLIAFFSWYDDLPNGYSPFGWLDLHSLPQVNHPLPEIIPYDFAFSPDNKQLAVYGCRREGEQECGIYLVEIPSGETTHLTSVERGYGLIWNKDSNALAIQGSFLRHGSWRDLVFDAESGNVIFDGPLDWEGFWASPESPSHYGDVPYPSIRRGLKLCSSPPQGE